MPNLRAKGSRLEYSVRDIFLAHGIKARRIPFSGSLGGSLCSDVHADIKGITQYFECKSRRGGWPTLYRLLAGNYGVILKADRDEPLIVMRLKDFAKVAA